MTAQPQSKFLWIAGLAAIAAIVGYYVLTAPDRRNGVQKLGDAVAQLPNGADKAARELKDRTPAERLSDDAKDAGDKLRGNADQ